MLNQGSAHYRNTAFSKCWNVHSTLNHHSKSLLAYRTIGITIGVQMSIAGYWAEDIL